jgi:hypothetical protein
MHGFGLCLWRFGRFEIVPLLAPTPTFFISFGSYDVIHSRTWVALIENKRDTLATEGNLLTAERVWKHAARACAFRGVDDYGGSPIYQASRGGGWTLTDGSG